MHEWKPAREIKKETSTTNGEKDRKKERNQQWTIIIIIIVGRITHYYSIHFHKTRKCLNSKLLHFCAFVLIRICVCLLWRWRWRRLSVVFLSSRNTVAALNAMRAEFTSHIALGARWTDINEINKFVLCLIEHRGCLPTCARCQIILRFLLFQFNCWNRRCAVLRCTCGTFVHLIFLLSISLFLRPPTCRASK